MSLLILRYVPGYTNDIPTAVGNFCFLLPGSLSPVRLPRRIKSLDTSLKVSDLNFCAFGALSWKLKSMHTFSH